MGNRQTLENSSRTVADTVPAGRYMTAEQTSQVSTGPLNVLPEPLLTLKPRCLSNAILDDKP